MLRSLITHLFRFRESFGIWNDLKTSHYICLNSGWPTITTCQDCSTIWPTSWRCKTNHVHVPVCPNCRNLLRIHPNSSKNHPVSFQIHPKSIEIHAKCIQFHQVQYPYPSKFQKGPEDVDSPVPGYRARRIRLDRSRCVRLAIGNLAMEKSHGKSVEDP